MNNLKKIGLSALAGSLVATSAFAGEMSVAGSASINVEHTNGSGSDSGKTFSMGNQLTFSGGGELDNGLSVALSFVLDQNDDSTAAGAAYAGGPFDSHSVTISSDAMGSLKFSGEGGSSALSALDGTAAGDIWDSFDIASSVHPTGLGGGDNSMMYTLPAMVDGVAINASYTPRGAAADSSTAFGVTYTGVEGLSVSYGAGENGSTTVATSADVTTMKGSYAIGSFTAAYSNTESDKDSTGTDEEMTSFKLSYTVTDDLSISYGEETHETSGSTVDEEFDGITVSYTTGGMTITAAQYNATGLGNTAGTTGEASRWKLGASFAF